MAATVNYDDQRFGKVESDKQQAMTQLEQTYAGMIGESDKYYQAQIDASKQWGETQQQLQQEQTDFTIEQIEQQKEKAHKDYLKEQSGAYVDWRKQSNEYGAEAEKMASSGLRNTGFSESSQVNIYNTYQNRVGVARESYNNVVLGYNNAIKEAQLQNSSALAEIAYQTLQQGLELSIQGFQYKNQLIQDQANKKLEMDQMYYQRYQDVLSQINYENEMAEQIRQYNQSYQLQIDKFNEEKRQFDAQMAEEQRQFNEQMAYTQSKSSGSGGGSGGSYSGGSGSGTSVSKSKSSSGSSGSARISNDQGTPGSEAVSYSNQPNRVPTNNTQSILGLGLGTLTASQLANLMSSGKVTRKNVNGEWVYSWTAGSKGTTTSKRVR